MDITDIETAKFVWVWSSRNQGPVTAFKIKVGVQTGQYDNITTIADVNLREYPMDQIISAPGSYVSVFCGCNTAGDGPNSTEIQFNVVMKPPTPPAGFDVTQG